MTDSNPVSWETAERVGAWVGSGRLRLAPGAPGLDLDPATLAQLESDFDEATAAAEQLVIEATGLQPPSGPPRGRVVDRASWVRSNVRTFQKLVGPLLEQVQGSGSQSFGRVLDRVAGPVTGTQLGLVLGWMSTRVLGQYDLLLTEDADDGDVVSYVGPNIVSLERRHGFPPGQFRLWIALHEVTHRCQFTAVPWLRGYFLSLVEEGLSSVAPDPQRRAEGLRRALEEVRAGRNPFEETGLLGIVAPEAQLETIGKIQALMSLLEGHGDITMDRAGAGAVPEAGWFSAVLRERRKKAGPAGRLMQQLIGLEAKFRQYEQGERFIAAVEAAGGPELLAHVWEGPEQLPTLDEIRDPAAWVARMSTPAAAAAD